MIELLKGRDRKLSLPNGEEHKAYYAIVDLDSIKASHNEISFSNTEGYPVNSNGENINDRNYKGDVSAQNNVNKIAENLNPESLISLSSTPAGTPIIDKNGIVVSGNNRVMSLKLAVKKYPANYEKYKRQLADDVDVFGFDDHVGTALLMNDSIPLPGSSYNEPLRIKFLHPVLVRVDESLPETLTTNDLAKFNQDSKKGERPLDRAIKLSNILLENDRCRNVILNILNGYDSFTDLYGYEGRFDRKKLIDSFVQCGLIPESQLPAYFDNNEFTEVGKDYIETLLSAIILTPDALRVSSAEGVKRLRQIVISSLPMLITNESLGNASLKNYISWAIIAQYKINQVGDFSDYIRTQSIFAEDKIDEKSLYVNALLRKGRNDFKTALKKYNESVRSNEGESLFNEAKLSPEKIFELTIEAGIDPQDKKLIQSIYPKNKKNNMAFETDLLIDSIPTIEDVVEVNNNDEFLFSDNWYKAYPNKILGTAYESSGRFGPVTKYKGTVDLLERIQVSESFIGADKGLIDPLASVFTDINVSAEIQKPDVQAVIKNAIATSVKEINSIKRKEVKKVDEEAVLMPVAEIRNFKESFFTLNPEISIEELEVYVWHKSKIGKPLSKNYVSIIKPDHFSSSEDLRDTYNYTVSEQKISDWVNAGLLFYYKNELYPAYEYLSGDMYAKQFALKHDKSEIIEKYGLQVFENQSKAIEAVFQQVYSRRLMIGGEKSLVLLANSKFAQEFMISRIIDIPEEKKFKIRKVTAASNKDYGKPDLINDHKTSEYQKDEFEELSLDIAFGWWVLNSKPQLKEPISHLDIVKYYVLGTKIMIPADDDTPAAKKAAEAKKERLKSSVQREGERFFNEFLETQLLPNDKVKLETKWNMDYNNHFPVDLNKVPVAFRMAKYIMGKEEVIRPEKRDAVAFTMNNGTGILSYDVGVGKGNLLTSNILTPSGYVKMGTVKVGDEVIGKNGKPTKIIGVFPQGKMQCYKVTFSDGSFTEVTDNHIWTVQSIHNRCHHTGNWENFETKDLIDNLFNYRGDYKYSIPMVESVEFDKQELPIHPYLLGVILGDGSISQNDVRISNPELDIIEKVKSLLPGGVVLKPKGFDNLEWRIVRESDSGNNIVIDKLRDLELMGTKSNTKFIPEIYKVNSPENRIEILRGLIDTDGYTSKNNSKKGCLVQYTTVSKQLKDDVIFLVQSFGGTAICSEKYPTYTHNGESKTGQLAYTITIRMPKDVVIVSSVKHLLNFEPKTKYQPVRFIQSIEDIGMHEAQCIKVAAEDSLYVCDDFIVTHNTPSAIFTISAFMDAGYCRHPLIVVPNQVYKQFISEIKMFTPHIPVIEAYNLSKEYAENFRDADGTIKPSPSGSITIMTYEGFENIGFSDKTTNKLIGGLYEILNQGGESEKSEKKKASFQERIEALVGKGLKGGMYSVEEFGFDFICYDEAHKMKKVFTSVKGEAEESEGGKTTRGRNPYAITSGTPSSIALKGFMVNYYILQENNYKNILLLTATPFTNSPLEIFSMLAMVAYEQLQSTNLNNLKTFFDTYIKASNELVINSKLKPQFKQVILGFNNLISLQLLIRRFILYKTGEDVNIQRPKKYVLPYLKTIENGIIVDLPEDKKVETYISMTPQQQAMMDDIIDYVENGSNLASKSYGDSEGEEVVVDDDEVTDETEGVDVDEDSLDDQEKLGVRTIKGLSYSRNVALSPYLYEHSGLGTPNSKQYIETSPKLLYVMNCIRSVREYHLFKGTPVSGQVIYMDRGIKYFHLIKEYLINEIGYAPHEVGIIQSGLPKNGVRSKEYVKNLMNGEIYNEKTKEFEPVPDKDRIKVVIGSSTIKEGINLQKYSTVLYNCFIDWNPTDIQQLEGRIYRQKNTFDAVRITNPLVVDSADIFLFQKLQEKTARLNTIWSTDGHSNVLHTEELNPEELKYALIKNPRIIAELRIIEQKAKFQSDILGVNRQKEIAERVMMAASTLNYRYQTLIDELKEYRDFKPTGDKIEDSIKLLQITNDLEKKQTDKQGKKIFDQWEWKYLDEKEKDKIGDNRSPMPSKFHKPYWFSDFAVAARDMKRYMNDFINQYKIRFDIDNYKLSLEDFIHKIDSQVEVIENKIKELGNKEYIDNLVREAIEEKERQKITYKPLMAVVKDFAKLNYLLDLTKVIKSVEPPIYNTCPPIDTEGRFAIDPVAIKYLESCIMNMPQTKSLHYNEETQQYLPKRERLHEEIIDGIFEGVKCVANDKPIAIFTGGSPASGKSYFIKKNAKYLDDDNIFKLDADEIRSKLPEYEGWNANTTHLETQDIVNTLLNRIGSETCRYDLIYDGTMNKAKKYFELIKKVRDLGYKVYIIFMDIPYHEAKKRALLRYQRSGRYVPMEVIDDFFTDINGKSKGQTALDELKPLVDGYVVADGISGEIIEQGGEGLPGKRDKGVYAESKPKLLSDSSSVKNVSKEVVTDVSNTIKSYLPKSGELKGVTEVEVSENGEEVRFGTKTNKTRISVEGLSAADIKQEIDFEKKILEKSKKDAENFNENEIRSARGLTAKQKEDAIKMHKQSLINNEQVEKIVIPFYEKQLEIKSSSNKETTSTSKLKLSDIPEVVKSFMPVMQQKAIVGSEEHSEIINDLLGIIEKMPKTYGTENTPTDEKVVYLHYFYGQSDWYIVEKDMEREQLQAFGYVILNGDTQMAEWGYINIEELKKTNRVELDFYFTPIKFGGLKNKWADQEPEVISSTTGRFYYSYDDIDKGRELGNQLKDSLKHDFVITYETNNHIQIESNKQGVKDTPQIVVNDNGGEFNLIDAKTRDHITDIPYDTTNGLVSPARLADEIGAAYRIYQKEGKVSFDALVEIINPNTDAEFNEAVFEQVEPSDEWIGHLIKERAIKKQLSEIVKGATPEDIEKLFYEYKDWFIKKEGGPGSSVKKITTKESTLKLIATLKTALKFSKGENKKTIQKRIKALELSIKYLN